MRSLRRAAVVAALAVSATSGGCGPLVVAGPSIGVGLDLGWHPNLRIVPTNCHLYGSPFAPAGLNAAILAGERQRQVNQVQSRFSLASSDVRATQARWRTVAESGC